MAVSNTLAYYSTVTITVVKGFIVQPPQCVTTMNLAFQVTSLTMGLVWPY